MRLPWRLPRLFAGTGLKRCTVRLSTFAARYDMRLPARTDGKRCTCYDNDRHRIQRPFCVFFRLNIHGLPSWDEGFCGLGILLFFPTTRCGSLLEIFASFPFFGAHISIRTLPGTSCGFWGESEAEAARTATVAAIG